MTATTEENGDLVEELIRSQEEEPGNHYSIREIAPQLSTGRSSIQRLSEKGTSLLQTFENTSHECRLHLKKNRTAILSSTSQFILFRA